MDNVVESIKGIDYELLELEEIQEIIDIRGASSNEKAGSATYAFSSTVENEVIHREDRKL